MADSKDASKGVSPIRSLLLPLKPEPGLYRPPNDSYLGSPSFEAEYYQVQQFDLDPSYGGLRRDEVAVLNVAGFQQTDDLPIQTLLCRMARETGCLLSQGYIVFRSGHAISSFLDLAKKDARLHNTGVAAMLSSGVEVTRAQDIKESNWWPAEPAVSAGRMRLFEEYYMKAERDKIKAQEEAAQAEAALQDRPELSAFEARQALAMQGIEVAQRVLIERVSPVSVRVSLSIGAETFEATAASAPDAILDILRLNGIEIDEVQKKKMQESYEDSVFF